MASQTPAIAAAAQIGPRARLRLLVGATLLIVLTLSALAWPAEARRFPEGWNLGLREPVDAFQSWVITSRASNPIFTLGFDPLRGAIDGSLRIVEGGLLGLSWLSVLAIIGLLGYLGAGLRLALLCVGGLLLAGMFGLWEPSMQTLALMGCAVSLSLLIGIPLGVAAGLSSPFEHRLRPLLDAMQTMPAFVYLSPVLLFFGIARAPAVVATLIYALPPIIRLTSMGIRHADPAAVEAARAFGATPRQLLLRVQMPLALPEIMAGVNQTIMMALSMVVIAAMIGAGGLGREVLVALQRLNVGQALEAGLVIVTLAIILDRLSAALGRIDLAAPPEAGRRDLLANWPTSAFATRQTNPAYAQDLRRFARPINAALLLLLILLADVALLHLGGFPAGWRISLRGPANAAVAWARDNLYQIGGLPIGTGPLSDTLTIYLLNPMRNLLLDWLPWPAVILAVAGAGYAAGSWRLAAMCAGGMLLIGMLGMWVPSMDTLSQVVITVLVSVAIAVPLGVLSAQSPAARAALRPILAFFQTVPAFVYLVPVIMLVNIGRVPGLIAAVLYAVPPGIKLTELGLSQVPTETVEAARSFGATRAQLLLRVQLPLATPAIMLAVNQMIMMVLAMVIIAGLVGGAGLGLEAVIGLGKNQTGRGIESGLAILIIATILDRITQAWAAQE
ncbi:MAG: ABC transporter permease subunit [Chloroflexales bacterium]